MSSNTNNNNYYLSFVVGLVVTLLCVALMLFLFTLSLKANQRQLASAHFASQDRVREELFSTLLDLNSRDFEPCSEENLLAMRYMLFQADFIRQITYYEGELAKCNTSVGILDAEFSLPEADFVMRGHPPTEVWIRETVDRPTIKAFTASITRSGNYSLMIDANVLLILNTGPFMWELFQRNPVSGETTLINSAEKLINQTIPDFREPPHIPFLDYAACNEEALELCLSMRTNINALWQTHAHIFILTGLLSLSLGFITGILMKQYLQARSKIPSRIKHALLNWNFVCYFQPIVELNSRRIIGCEVLTRLEDKLGTLCPRDFLSEVERSGMTWHFTRQVITQIFSLLEKEKELPEGFRLSLNIFPRDINSGVIRELLSISRLCDSKLNISLEIIEDASLDNTSEVHALLNELADAGFEIAIDDFGSGYSNFERIGQLSCTCLKIDHSFVNGINSGSLQASLIPHMVNMAKEFNFTLIAEGIENAKQLKYLRQKGVPYGQGFLFGHIFSLEEFERMLNQQKKQMAHQT